MKNSMGARNENDGNIQERELQSYVNTSMRSMYKNRFQKIHDRIDKVLTTISNIDRKVDEMHREITSKIQGCKKPTDELNQGSSEEIRSRAFVSKSEKNGDIFYNLSFSKDLLISGHRFNPTSKNDEEKEVELQTIFPEIFELISENKNSPLSEVCSPELRNAILDTPPENPIPNPGKKLMKKKPNVDRKSVSPKPKKINLDIGPKNKKLPIEPDGGNPKRAFKKKLKRSPTDSKEKKQVK